MDKYLKHLRKSTVKKKITKNKPKNRKNSRKNSDHKDEEFDQFSSSFKVDFNKSPEELNDEIFYKYLRPLSSKLTLVALTFTKKEFDDIIQQKEYKVNFHNELCEEIGGYNDTTQQITKYAILLETRLCSKKPDLHYYLLKDHPKISEFEQMVQQKITKINDKNSDEKEINSCNGNDSDSNIKVTEDIIKNKIEYNESYNASESLFKFEESSKK